MDIYFSKSKLAFIPGEWKEDGTYNEHSWPSDALVITEQERNDYWKVSPPGDKVLGATEDGRPCWSDLPPLTRDEIVSSANTNKLQLSMAAEQAIRPLERAKQLGIATDEELALLAEWELYSVLLMRVDTSKAPDIDWPKVPQ